MKKCGIFLLPDACYLSELNVPSKPNRTNLGECAAIQRFRSTPPNENLAILTPYRNQRALLADTAKKCGYPQEVSLWPHTPQSTLRCSGFPPPVMTSRSLHSRIQICAFSNSVSGTMASCLPGTMTQSLREISTVWVLPTMSRLRLPYTVFPIYRSSRKNFATRLAVQKFSSRMLRHGVHVQPVSIL